jgi:F-type H+-transporting ATPase subunit delta
MDASSREAIAAARERLAERTQGAPGQSLLNLADELFSVARLLDGEPSLRRALSDPGVKPADRGGLARRLMSGKVSDTALDTVETVARQRWSRPRDLVEAMTLLAQEAAFDASGPRRPVGLRGRQDRAAGPAARPAGDPGHRAAAAERADHLARG